MSQFSEKELIKIPLSRLLKVEVPRFALRLIGIVEEHNPEELQIKEIYDLLVAEKPNIDKLKDKYGPHPLTEELKEHRRMRALYVSSIRFRLKVVMREDKSGVDKNVKIVRNAVNLLVNNLDLSKNEEMINQKMAHFFTSIEEDVELEAAFETLGFTEYLDELQSVHSTIQELIYNKLSSISARPQETTAYLKKSVLTAVKNQIKQIEIASLKHTDLNYGALFGELNRLLIEYRDLINKRILFNKRRAENKAMDESGETTETSHTTHHTESARTIMHLNADEVEMNGMETELVENEKAVALSSKPMQLPSIIKKQA